MSADSARAFGSKSRLAQAAVLIAGVTMNVLFAWILFLAVFLIGVPTSVSEDASSDAATLTVAGVVADGPAAEAGIVPGADIVRVTAGGDELASLTPSAFAIFTHTHADKELAITYILNDEEVTAFVTPQTEVIADDPTQPAVGVALSLVETVRYSIGEAVIEATDATFSSLVAITVGISSLIADAVTFEADLSGVAGPIGIVGMVEDAADFGLTSLLLFTAMISLNLAIINLLPVPALDGGRLIFVAIESVIRRPLNPVWAGRANLVGFGLLMVLMLAVTYNDILRII